MKIIFLLATMLYCFSSFGSEPEQNGNKETNDKAFLVTTEADETAPEAENVIVGFWAYDFYQDGTCKMHDYIAEPLTGDVTVKSIVDYNGKQYRCETVPDGALSDSKDSRLDESFYKEMKTLTFEEGITTINETMGHLNRCRKISIPKSVTYIRENAFIGGISSGYQDPDRYDYTSSNLNFTFFDLEEINVDPDNMVYASKDGVLYDKEMKTLIVCPRAKTGTFIIPEGVETLGDRCFISCNLLTEIRLPSTLKTIGTKEGRGAFYFCCSLKSITIPEGVERIEPLTFRDCVDLTNVTLPNSVKFIGLYAFSENWSLSSFDWQECKIDSIEEQAFYNCPNWKVTLPKSIRYIGAGAFLKCDIPQELIFPADLEEIVSNTPVISGSSAGNASDILMPLKDIYCYMEKPFEADTLLFGTDITYEGRTRYEYFPMEWARQCTLHVPTGSSDYYRASDLWKHFPNIVEFDTSATNIVIPTDNRKTHKDGIYTINGTKVREQTQSVEGLPKGIYIVDGKKVIVK